MCCFWLGFGYPLLSLGVPPPGSRLRALLVRRSGLWVLLVFSPFALFGGGFSWLFVFLLACGSLSLLASSFRLASRPSLLLRASVSWVPPGFGPLSLGRFPVALGRPLGRPCLLPSRPVCGRRPSRAVPVLVSIFRAFGGPYGFSSFFGVCCGRFFFRFVFRSCFLCWGSCRSCGSCSGSFRSCGFLGCGRSCVFCRGSWGGAGGSFGLRSCSWRWPRGPFGPASLAFSFGCGGCPGCLALSGLGLVGLLGLSLPGLPWRFGLSCGSCLSGCVAFGLLLWGSGLCGWCSWVWWLRGSWVLLCLLPCGLCWCLWLWRWVLGSLRRLLGRLWLVPSVLPRFLPSGRVPGGP